MKKKFPIWLVGVIVLAGTLAYVKWEMVRNRRMATEETDPSAADAPEKVAAQSAQKLEQAARTNAPSPVPPAWQPNPTQDVVSGALDTVAKAGQSAGRLLTTNSSAQPTPENPNPPQTPLGGLLDLASKTAQKVDQAGQKLTEMSDDDETRVGNQLDREILREMKPAEDPKAQSRLEALARPLIEQVQRKNIRYQVRLVKSSRINAFSCAGGHVYVTTAFLKRFTTDEELAMTLGHEIAHVDLKHAVHKVQYLSLGKRTLGDVAIVGQALYSLLSSPYAKDLEFEADATGFDACRKAGWEAAKLVELYEGFIQLEKEQAGGKEEPASGLEKQLGDVFKSHPGSAERLARLKSRAGI